MWWTELNLFQQIFFLIGIPSVTVLIIQTVLVLLGVGHDDDMDVGMDAEVDGDLGTGITGDPHTGLGLFSVRGIFAFLATTGFMGFWLGGYHPTLHYAVAGVISAAAGLVMMLAIFQITKSLMKLQEQGNIDYQNAVGHTAAVYIPIPAARAGRGKISITIQEKLVEIDAVTDGEGLKSEAAVRVVEQIDETTVRVEPA
ncbi:MAG: hypothetical protein LBM78_00945 [Clostridiales bacterium]|jgi:hypothetical protein|nr:hypothetical protein [Clostridiales bacterium]